MGRTFRILSLDGGGVRGWLSARLMDRLAESHPGWWRRADLVAGTSTGALLALGLAAGRTPRELMALYETNAARIFRDDWLDNVRDLGRTVGAQYDDRGLRQVLREVFGELRLRELPVRVLIPAFDLDNEQPDPAKRSWAPKFFHNFPGPDSDGERRVRDVALYSSAAPTYFPSADGYIDGGVIANNPAMAALAQTQDPRNEGARPRLSSIVMLSIGTGRPLLRIEGRRHDWGLAQWSRPILDIMMEAGMGVPDYQCRQLLGDRYHRLEPVLPSGAVIRMDDVRRMGELAAIADGMALDTTVAWLGKYWGDAGGRRARRG
ncbi:MAG: patatin-like phospholipase family protein [Kiritimatiellae bacterium]|nr:patatin-like phospholipase family protein [Kiritimatiellia bacterium]